MAYIYIHRAKNTNKLFMWVLVKNNDKSYFRASCIYSRNPLWNNIVKKHGFTFEIISDNLDKETAFELEMFLIKEYGRM